MEQRGFRGAILRGSGLFFPRFAAEWDAGEGSPGGLVVNFSVFLIGNCSTDIELWWRRSIEDVRG
jgi:hypothetical protein